MNAIPNQSIRIIKQLICLFAVSFCVAQNTKDTNYLDYKEKLEAYEAKPDAYSELYRQQFHFSPYNIWINDPNGLAYFNDTWHLFFQHYLPKGGVSWGHAISKDLVHWEQKPPALFEDDLGAIFSGSGVIDKNNTTGFFEEGDAKYVGIFTYNKYINAAEGAWQSQAIAYSKDGENFTKYENNPVIKDLREAKPELRLRDFRDPKVFWHAPTKRWAMVVGGGPIQFYSSENLKDWKYESRMADAKMECPDLFELPIENTDGEKKWVLSHAGKYYQLGDFDGHKFTPSTEKIPMNFGPDFYASQSWDNAPNGRRIMISWMHSMNYAGEWPGRPGHSMSLPMEMALKKTPQGVKLFQTPVKELEKLRKETISFENVALKDTEKNLENVSGRLFEMESTWLVNDKTTSKDFGFKLLKGADGTSVRVGYDVERKEVYLDRSQGMWQKVSPFAETYRAKVLPVNGKIKLRLFLDYGSLELFVNDGEAVISAAVLAQPGANKACLFSEEGEAILEKMNVYPFQSIWDKKSKDASGIHIWSSLRIEVGKSEMLAANPWPNSGKPLTFENSNPEIAKIETTDNPNWIKINALKAGNTTITAKTASGESQTSTIYVFEDGLVSNASYMWEDGIWNTDSSGLKHLSDEQHSVLGSQHGEELTFTTNVTIDEANGVGGIFIRSGGKGKFGYFIRVDHKNQEISVGRWKGPVLESKPYKLKVGKTYQLQVEENSKDNPGKLVISLNGKKKISVKQMDSPSWGRRMGVFAEGKVTLQDINVTAYK